MSSKFFINGDRNLLDKFTGILENMKDLYAFYAVVDYFRSSPKFSKNVSKESKAKKNGSAPKRFFNAGSRCCRNACASTNLRPRTSSFTLTSACEKLKRLRSTAK